MGFCQHLQQGFAQRLEHLTWTLSKILGCGAAGTATSRPNACRRPAPAPSKRDPDIKSREAAARAKALQEKKCAEDGNADGIQNTDEENIHHNKKQPENKAL